MRELLRPQLQRRGAYCNHVSIALGSQAELETQIEVALRQKYMTPASARPVVQRTAQVGQMLNGLMRSLKRRLRDQRRQAR
jgi:four helix bundle protein